MMLWLERLKIGAHWVSRLQFGTALDIATSKMDTSDRMYCQAFGDEQSKVAWEIEKIRNCQNCSLVKEHVVKQAK
ncbi:MAG: hypothetical protein Metus_1372 [Candidatus Methanosuratincola subterraneus]|jgi:hypothetical protein|uniref:Uncharacterized protein n=1 Tax=Methanosuratincola subterraneus TaxID=2593994 RepID=A0A444L765_METS7|nr:MAG: hypothetical protein Metus_1372 [Candidatus Methanosuratincola subterraneus]